MSLNLRANSIELPDRIAQRSNLVFIFVVCACAFAIQFGGQSTIASVSFAAFTLIWIVAGLRIADIRLGITLLILMSISLFWQLGSPDLAAILSRQIREFVCLLLIVSTPRFAGRPIHPQHLLSIALIVQLTCIALAVVQWIGLKMGQPLAFLPYELYGNIAGEEVFANESRRTTIPTAWLEFGAQLSLNIGSDLVLRPVAFYTEPSYAGFILLSCAYLTEVANYKNVRLVLATYGLSFLGSMICSSGSGLLCTLLMASVYYVRSSRQGSGGTTLLLAGLVAPLFLAVTVWERLSNIGQLDGDLSGFGRLVLPFIQISKMLEDGYFFGITSRMYVNYLDPYITGVYLGYGTDNGVLNLLLSYGAAGLVIIALSASRLWLSNAIFFLCAGQFNGSLLSYDKGVIVAAILIQSYGFRNIGRAQ